MFGLLWARQLVRMSLIISCYLKMCRHLKQAVEKEYLKY